MSTNLHELDKLKDPDELVKKLVSWNDDEETRYLTQHAENEKNALFYLGKQWLEAKRGIDGQIIYEEDDDRYRPVTNLIGRACDLKRSQILGRNIRPKTAPASEKKNDIDTAQISTLALRARQVIDGDAAVDKLTFLHSQVFGTGWRADFKKLKPDESIQKPVMRSVTTEFFQCEDCGGIDEYKSICPDCGSPMQFQTKTDETPDLDEMGQPRVDVIPLYEIVCENIDSFRMKTSMSPTKEKLKWITDSSLQSIDWIKETFNQKLPGFLPQNLGKLKGVKALPRGLRLSEEFQATVTLVHSSTSEDVYKNSVDARQKDMEENKTILHKSYFAPTVNHKKGRLIIWTPDAVLYDGLPDVPKNPDLRRWHPYTPRRWRKHPIRFEGIPYINDGIPINKKLNSLDSMIMEHLDKTACPVRVDFQDTLINNDDNSEGIITVKARPELAGMGGGIPTYLQHPQMASEVYKMRDAIIDEFNKQMNITDIMQGFHPAGVDTYRGMELLKDSANSAEAETYEEQYEYVKEAARLKLALIQECVVAGDEQMLKIMNQILYDEDFGIDELRNFSGEDLGNNLNIVIEESDYLSQSTAAEADRVKGLLEAQLLSPQDLSDPIIKLTMLRKFGMGQMPMPDKRNIEKAERIINLIEAGRGQEVFGILRVQDNKGIQLRVWNDWVLTSRFDSLPPEIQNVGLQVIKTVEDQLLAAQNALQNPPARNGGSPPPPKGVNPPPMPPQGQGGPVINP